MHYCPDCGEECNCSCDYYLYEEDCEHICGTDWEKDYKDYEAPYDPFEDIENYDED